MINFRASSKNVKLYLKYKSGAVDTSLFFYWETNSEVTAEALSNQLQDLYEKSVEREIRTAYESGYQAGRKRKAKRTWFHSYIQHINEALQDWKKE